MADPPATTRRPWLVVLLLLLVGVLNYLDRVLPAILAEPIKHELELSDTALGLINGFGFLLIYAAASIPMATMSDRGHYGRVVTYALAAWSLMTAAGALVANGWQMALSRMGVAVGESAGMPAAHAYITRHFAPDKRAAAIAVFNLSLPFGSMAGFVVGGVLGEQLGWRQTFLIMGVLGLALAVVTVFALPAKAKSEAAPMSANLSLFGFVPLLKKRSLALILIGSAFLGMGGYTATAFTPAFLMRSHGMSLADAGFRFGLAGGITAAAALLVVGWLAGRLSARDARWLPGSVVVMVALALPFTLLAFRTGNETFAIAALAITYVVPIAYSAPTAVALHRLAPLELRARMSAMLLLATGVAGGIGPLVVGAVSDALTPLYGPDALRRAMQLIPVAYLIGALCFLAALENFRAELVED